MTLWLVGQFKAEVEQGIVWEFQGIFTTRELAVAACRNENYCVQTVQLDEPSPDERVDFADCEYPKRQGL